MTRSTMVGGYFATDTLRAYHLPTKKISLFTTPKHRIHKMLLGPEYRTERSPRWDDGPALKDLYSDLSPSSKDGRWVYLQTRSRCG